jgi:hypothetical protein
LRKQDFSLSGALDIYRDRVLFNPDKSHALNYDGNIAASFFLNDSSRLTSSLYYLNTPGLISPTRSVRLNNRYTKKFKLVNNRSLSIFLGNSYSKNRYPLTPSSDYNNYGVSAGISFPLISDLYYNISYAYNRIEDIASGETGTPRVMTTGLSYYKSLTPSLRGRFNLTYRDEEKTQGIRTFLAGEDSLDVEVGLNYDLSKDVNFFTSARLRNIWAESADRDAFNEADFRFGFRSRWDSPFHWSPQGVVRGIVFDDLNADSKKDKDEEGVADVTINIGDKKVKTNKNGSYKASIKAKKSVVSLDFASLPKGYVASGQGSYVVDISEKTHHRIDFGITRQSGIYGVVFCDQDGNGKPGLGDIFISGVNIILDKTKRLTTDFEGGYFFRNVPGGTHIIMLDVNSLPLQYLPLIKIKNEIELEEGTTYIFHIPVQKK